MSPRHEIFFEASHWPTRQQTVGRINQVADCGDGDEDKNKDEDEIPSYAVLLTALVKSFGVSRMRDF